MQMRVGGLGAVAALGLLVSGSSCGSTARSSGAAGSSGVPAVAGATSQSAGATLGGAAGMAATSDAGSAGDGVAGEGTVGAGGDGAVSEGGVPATCQQAAAMRTHFGCEFWPTIVANPVWSEFSPGVIVANPGARDASVVVTGRDGFQKAVTVPGGASETVLLDWIVELKGEDWSHLNTSGGRVPVSALVHGAAYKVESDVPLAAWQLNPAEAELPGAECGLPSGSACRAASGDGSLLLPASSLTGNYRVLSLSTKSGGDAWGSIPGGFALTATRDGTIVQAQLPLKCGFEKSGTSELGACTSPGNGVAQKSAGEVYSWTLNAGDVVQVAGAAASTPGLRHADLSGAIINADKPVQIISFTAAANLPDDSVPNSDHIEEVTPPAESFGQRYVVMPPSSPFGRVGHVVRIYGNVDGTQLSYPEGKPAGAPDVINAGQVAHIPPLSSGELPSYCLKEPPHCIVDEPFSVEGSEPFAVASFLVGGLLQSPGTDATTARGDPSGSWLQDPRLFQKKYAFFVPEMLERVADVLAPTGARVLVDGQPMVDASPIEHGEWTLWKVAFGASGYHEVETDDERGIFVQILGFGFAASYYYPAGGSFKLLSQPPVIIP